MNKDIQIGAKIKVIENNCLKGVIGEIVHISHGEEFPIETLLFIDGIGWTQSDFNENQIEILEQE